MESAWSSMDSEGKFIYLDNTVEQSCMLHSFFIGVQS